MFLSALFRPGMIFNCMENVYCICVLPISVTLFFFFLIPLLSHSEPGYDRGELSVGLCVVAYGVSFFLLCNDLKSN